MVMSYLPILLSSAISTAILIVLLRGAASRLNLVDQPDERKTHDGVIPIHGGLCMALVMLAVATGLYFRVGLSPAEWVLILGLVLFAVIGVLDDRHDLSASLRLVIELIVLLWLMYTFGFRLENLGNLWGYGEVHLGWLALPFTLFAIFSLINGMNMLDGMDGLAGGVAAIGIFWFLMAANISGVSASPLVWTMLGSVLGFLFFNARAPWRSKATVFMGDAGSLVLGFVLCWCCIAYTQGDVAGGGAAVSPMAAVWIMAVPVIDTVYVVISRARAGTGIFTPGRDHIHHRLQQLGFSDTATVRLLWAVSVLLGAVGVGANYLGLPDFILCYGFLVLALLYYLIASRMQSVISRDSDQGQ